VQNALKSGNRYERAAAFRLRGEPAGQAPSIYSEVTARGKTENATPEGLWMQPENALRLTKTDEPVSNNEATMSMRPEAFSFRIPQSAAEANDMLRNQRKQLQEAKDRKAPKSEIKRLLFEIRTLAKEEGKLKRKERKLEKQLRKDRNREIKRFAKLERAKRKAEEASLRRQQTQKLVTLQSTGSLPRIPDSPTTPQAGGEQIASVRSNNGSEIHTSTSENRQDTPAVVNPAAGETAQPAPSTRETSPQSEPAKPAQAEAVQTPESKEKTPQELAEESAKNDENEAAELDRRAKQLRENAAAKREAGNAAAELTNDPDSKRQLRTELEAIGGKNWDKMSLEEKQEAVRKWHDQSQNEADETTDENKKNKQNRKQKILKAAGVSAGFITLLLISVFKSIDIKQALKA
jgi:hypothetical protein